MKYSTHILPGLIILILSLGMSCPSCPDAKVNNSVILYFFNASDSTKIPVDSLGYEDVKQIEEQTSFSVIHPVPEEFFFIDKDGIVLPLNISFTKNTFVLNSKLTSDTIIFNHLLRMEETNDCGYQFYADSLRITYSSLTIPKIDQIINPEDAHYTLDNVYFVSIYK